MSRFSLWQLEAWLGRIRVAATHQHVSQPTVSQRLRELTDTLESMRFDRG